MKEYLKQTNKHAKRYKSKLHILIISVIVGMLYMRIGRDTLFDWDEGIYAELGREITSFQRVITPTWNYDIWLEKPPAIAWVTKLGMAIFGENEVGARFFMPIFAGITLYFTFLIGSKLKNKTTGMLATLLLANMNLFLSRARAVNTDSALLASITMTVYSLLSNNSPLITAIAISIGIFFKGIAGLLTVIVSIPLLLSKSRKFITKTAIYSLLITVPWHIYQLLFNGDNFITPYIKEQVIRRATVPIEFHMESRWFYFTYLYKNLNPSWIFLAISGAVTLIYTAVHLIKQNKLKYGIRYLVVVWWILVPLSIFTLAKTRLFWYILPIYPAIAISIAYLFGHASETKKHRYVLISFISLYFIYTTKHILQNIEFNKRTATETDTIMLAKRVSNMNGNRFLVLVPETERIAEAVLPKEQRISSSFRYGGAPSLVFYSRKKTLYFYNIDNFIKSLQPNDIAMLTTQDMQKLKSRLKNTKTINRTKDYTLIFKQEDI